MKRRARLVMLAVVALLVSWYALAPAPLTKLPISARTGLFQAGRLLDFPPRVPSAQALGLQLSGVQVTTPQGLYRWPADGRRGPLPAPAHWDSDPLAGYPLQLVYRDPNSDRNLWLWEGRVHHPLPNGSTVKGYRQPTWYAEMQQGTETLRILRWREGELELTLMSSSLSLAQLKALAEALGLR